MRLRKLKVGEIRTHLNELKGWRITGKRVKKLVKRFSYEGFMPGVELINEIAKVAEEMNHHPDVYLSYGSIRFVLTTHDIGGLSTNDVELAKKIDAIVASTLKP
ncbi:MAG: 4a-hydroxytetrahydrobiopterin dehydratase [Aigarchaeota archaeon]|nr:4a-hydroxytetrahydrobiopterin dehydratase [Aigarchaeota archaeon]MDW8092573.1 4a-hydroxytetrahydrobiopterin dehydratase [Nitrososphaerota archaeon]